MSTCRKNPCDKPRGGRLLAVVSFSSSFLPCSHVKSAVRVSKLTRSEMNVRTVTSPRRQQSTPRPTTTANRRAHTHQPPTKQAHTPSNRQGAHSQPCPPLSTCAQPSHRSSRVTEPRSPRWSRHSSHVGHCSSISSQRTTTEYNHTDCVQ
jgi:hypothetical protein